MSKQIIYQSQIAATYTTNIAAQSGVKKLDMIVVITDESQYHSVTFVVHNFIDSSNPTSYWANLDEAINKYNLI